MSLALIPTDLSTIKRSWARVMGEVWITVYPIHTGSGGARSLFLLGHKWGTIISKGGGMMVWVLSLECLRPAHGHGAGGWVQDVVAPSTKGARGC